MGRCNAVAFLENLGAAINNGLWSARERESRCLLATLIKRAPNGLISVFLTPSGNGERVMCDRVQFLEFPHALLNLDLGYVESRRAGE